MPESVGRRGLFSAGGCRFLGENPAVWIKFDLSRAAGDFDGKRRFRARGGNSAARDLVTYFVGQGVGLIDSVKSARQVVEEFKLDFADGVEDLQNLLQ